MINSNYHPSLILLGQSSLRNPASTTAENTESVDVSLHSTSDSEFRFRTHQMSTNLDTCFATYPESLYRNMHSNSLQNYAIDKPIESMQNASSKVSTFPMKLHYILSNKDLEDIISWLPHGRSWRILQPRIFERLVIPLYFGHGKYSSFARQVNGWGFRRITNGPDYNSYYHESFVRDMPQLCAGMRRLRSKGVGRLKRDESTPNFYAWCDKISFSCDDRKPAEYACNDISFTHGKDSLVNPRYAANNVYSLTAGSIPVLQDLYPKDGGQRDMTVNQDYAHIYQQSVESMYNVLKNETLALLKSIQQQMDTTIPIGLHGYPCYP